MTIDHSNDDDALALYSSALTALMSSEHQAITKEAIEKTSQRRTDTVHDIHRYMQRIGLLNEKLQPIEDATVKETDDGKISVIHVAGTKGKGSVCAMCEVMMRKNQPNTITGLFTSPHLVDIRERIRINGLPVSKQIFGQAYWSIRECLEQYKNGDDEIPALPGYFRMITLLALYIFKKYRTDDEHKRRITCVVLEVGMGGRYDATNVRLPWTNPTTVCGTTLIDYDHVRILGHTLPAIAWEKGGIYLVNKGCYGDKNDNDISDRNDARTPHPIREEEQFMAAVANMKSNVNISSQSSRRCFALDTNDESVIDVFRLCAINEGQGDSLILAGPLHNPQLPPSDQRELGLKGAHQRENAELAIALCQAIMYPTENESIQANGIKIYEALYDMTWPGRCQTERYNVSDATQKKYDLPITIRLDGAHTIQSVRAGLEWYNSVTDAAAHRNDANSNVRCGQILVFNCSHERNPVELLDLLFNSKTKFHAVYFCRADSERPSAITKSSTIDLWQTSYKNEVTDVETLRSAIVGGDTPTWQDTLLGIWNLLELTSTTTLYKAMDRASNLTCDGAIQRGYEFVSARTNEFTSMEIFCTGSLYLVGSMLTSIHWQEEEATGQLVTL